jgi:serine/threonine-protein kinase
VQRLNRLLLAFVPAILLLSSCNGARAVGDNNQATAPVSATAPAAVIQTPAPPIKVPPVAKLRPLVVADPYAAAKSAGASAVCADGSWSFSKHRSGTCSGHGGVHWWTGNLGAAGPGAH